MVVAALVHDLSNLSIDGHLHLLLRRAIGMSALVIADRVLASLNLFLAILPPVVSII